MKKFGRREDDMPPRLPSLVSISHVPSLAPVENSHSSPPKREGVSTHHPVMPTSLRERVIEQIEPSVAATVSRDVLRRQIEEIIHGIANDERLELSGREQILLAEEIADDMTGYGPLRALLLDELINDIMINGPASVYVERKGKLERVAINSATTTILRRWHRKSPHRLAGVSTNPARWWTADCPTAVASTSYSHHWRSMVPVSLSENFRATVWTWRD